jgi:hypothetical protein
MMKEKGVHIIDLERDDAERHGNDMNNGTIPYVELAMKQIKQMDNGTF